MRPDKLPATISYHEDFGLWWPDYDAGPQKCHDYVQRHLTDCDVGIAHCSRKRIAVQAGGHAGLWPMRLAKSFGEVHTFEAEEALYKAMVKNFDGAANIYHYHSALSDCDGTLMLRPSHTAGSWRVHDEGTVAVKCRTIDSLFLKYCDLIVLDIEGHEAAALRGAVDTVKRHKPIIQVEMLPASEVEIDKQLRSMGYMRRQKAHGDWIYKYR